MLKKVGSSLLLITFIVLFLLWISTYPNVEFHLKDSKTKHYVQDPNIEAVDGLTQVAGPGTGGGGPLIYSFYLPKPVTIRVNTHGYEEKKVKKFLIPGLKYTIWLEKQKT